MVESAQTIPKRKLVDYSQDSSSQEDEQRDSSLETHQN